MLLGTFAILQVLDVVTTMIGLSLGAQEASPLARALMAAGIGQFASILGTKAAAVMLAAGCILNNRPRVVRWINYWYGALAVWNIWIIYQLAIEPAKRAALGW